MNTLAHNTLVCFEYFQKLWEQLQQQLAHRRDARYRQQRELKKVCNAVEAIVEGTDGRLRGVCNYQSQLREGACQLLQHIEDLVSRVPPPLLIDNTTLIGDPMVRTLLSDAETLHRLFIHNRHLERFFTTGQDAPDAAYALLFLRHREKTLLGTELHGEILLREVRQTAYKFYAHRLVAPCATEERARLELMIHLFEDVVRQIKSRILERKRQCLKRRHRGESFLFDENTDNPEVFIRMLVERLAEPEHLISLQDKLIRVNRMGIKIPLQSDLPSNLLQLKELQIADHPSQLVSIIRYPRDGFADLHPLRQDVFAGYGLENNSCRL